MTATPGSFLICIGDQPVLDAGGTRQRDGAGFAVCGRVVSGMDLVRDIQQMETLPDAPNPYLQGQMLRVPVPIFVARREPPDDAMRPGIVLHARRARSRRL